MALNTLTYAQESTPSSQTSAQEIQKSLQERIKKAIQGDISDSTPKLKAFVGSVDSITENTITITSTTQQVKHIIINQETEIVRGSTKVKLEAVKISEGIIGMGLTTDLQTQEAIRVVLFDPTIPKFTRSTVIGTLGEIDPKQETIEITPMGDSSKLTIDYTTTSSLLDTQLKKIKLTQLSSDQKVIAIISTNVQTKKQTLLKLLSLDTTQTQTSSPTPIRSTCGDKVCQNIVCQGIGCPQPETPETCPIDCTK